MLLPPLEPSAVLARVHRAANILSCHLNDKQLLLPCIPFGSTLFLFYVNHFLDILSNTSLRPTEFASLDSKLDIALLTARCDMCIRSAIMTG